MEYSIRRLDEKFFCVTSSRFGNVLCCTLHKLILFGQERESSDQGGLLHGVNNYSPLNGPSNFCGLNHRRISGISLGPSFSLHSLTSPGTFAALVAFLSIYSTETSRTHRSHHSGCSRNTWNSSWTCREQKNKIKLMSLFGVVTGFERGPVYRKSRLTGFN